MPVAEDIGQPKTVRYNFDDFRRGRYTRTAPHKTPDGGLLIADNVVFNYDGMVSKRPGSIVYGGYAGGGAQDGYHNANAMYRFYPSAGAPQLIVSIPNNPLYVGNDATGVLTAIGGTASSLTTNPTGTAQFTPMYDPDAASGAGATVLFVTDGSHKPRIYNGATLADVTTGSSGGVYYLPVGRTGNPITPAYCCDWKYHLVYAGEPTEPSAIYISDALRPQRFNGYGLIDSAGTQYTPYFPAGRDASLGAITGIRSIGPYLVIFYYGGVAVGVNTGTYGAFEYEFEVLSYSTGCQAPYSIVAFDTFIVFFGGDQFYATDGTGIYPLPDSIPDIYRPAQGGARYSAGIYSAAVASSTAARRGTKYLFGYTAKIVSSNGSQLNTTYTPQTICFDFAANGGFTPGASVPGADPSGMGGAWSRFPSGFSIAAGIECRGATDTFQFFWSNAATANLQLGQWDTGKFSDFNNAIPIELRTKAITLEDFLKPKSAQALYVMVGFENEYPYSATFFTTVNGYVITDSQKATCPAVTQTWSSLGGNDYADPLAFPVLEYKMYPSTSQGEGGFVSSSALQAGFTESSTQPFNLLSMILEVTVDDPQP